MYQDNGGGAQGGGFAPRAPRQMVDVSAMNITCSVCGAPIKELPFNPDPNRLNTLKCRACLKPAGPRRF